VANATNAEHAANATNAENAAHATNAETATNAQHATDATHATSATLFGSWLEVWHGSASEDIPAINAQTCNQQAVDADTAPGDIVLGTVQGGSAPNPLPGGLTATLLLDSGQVLLRLCNPTASNVAAFNLDWQFLVIRDTG
jgi:hypothetical protein